MKSGIDNVGYRMNGTDEKGKIDMTTFNSAAGELVR